MHLLKPDLVTVSGVSEDGHILFTESAFFALRSRHEFMTVGDFVGGIPGALIGGVIGWMHAKITRPEHLNHPEVAALAPSTRDELLTSQLLCCIPLSGDFAARRTVRGFIFTAKDHPEVVYKGFFHKRAILAFLRNRGVPVT